MIREWVSVPGPQGERFKSRLYVREISPQRHADHIFYVRVKLVKLDTRHADIKLLKLDSRDFQNFKNQFSPWNDNEWNRWRQEYKRKVEEILNNKLWIAPDRQEDWITWLGYLWEYKNRIINNRTVSIPAVKVGINIRLVENNPHLIIYVGKHNRRVPLSQLIRSFSEHS